MWVIIRYGLASDPPGNTLEDNVTVAKLVLNAQ